MSAFAGVALATNVSGCGGGSSTNSGFDQDAGDATSSGSGSSGFGSSGSSGSSSSSSSSSNGGQDATADSSSSSGSSGGADSGADSSDSSSSSSGGADSSADSSDSSSSSSGGSDSSADSSDSSSSSGGGDSGSDAAADAGVDAAVCTPNGSACALGSANGLCVSGACAACSGASGTNSACSMAYGDGSSTGYVCVSGSCTPGNCNTSSDCTGGTPACNQTTHTCVACDALGASATAVVVDPLNGSDAASSTGTGTAGGQTIGLCAFKTIGHALTHLGSATTVNVLSTGPVSVAGNGETFPIAVTQAGVTITGSGGTPTVNVITNTQAFSMSATGATLTNLLIDGSSTVSGGSPNPMGTHGILVASHTTAISNVEIRNFTEAGIRVEGGVATIGAGTNAHNDGIGGAAGLSGLHVTGTGVAVITGNASAAAIQFNSNGQNGILVDGGGAVTVTGSGAGGSVVAEHNSLDGLEIHQTVAAPSLNTITGLLSRNNTHDGARFYAHSRVKVRSSVFIGNTNGVDIEATTGGSAAANNDVSNIDLGTNTGAAAGLNMLQDTTTPNNGAGVCLNLTAGSGQVLAAQGNTWVAMGATAADVDCSMIAGALSEGAGATGRACAGAVDVGGSGLQGLVTPNGVAVNLCTCGGMTTCR